MSTFVPTDSPKVLASTDRLLRPFLIGAFVAVVATQLALSHASASGLGWVLFIPVALLSLATLLPWARAPFVVRVFLLTVFAVLSGILFAVPADTFSAGFVFIAALAAGLLLESHRTALWIAGAASASAALSSFIADQAFPQAYPWWLGLAAGLPVYIGIARSERAVSLRVAQVAVTESDRARASEGREAALLERTRIAREIHDVLGHSLSAISIQLDMAETLDANDRNAESMDAVRRARALARAGIGETRRAVHGLQDDFSPLPDTIQALAVSVKASFALQGRATPLRLETTQALIRGAQEALTNAHRHAPGALIDVCLRFEDFDDQTIVTTERRPSVGLMITNGPGVGYTDSTAEREGTGMGLQGMHERVSLLGGTVTAGPTSGAPAEGWSVEIRLPQ